MVRAQVGTETEPRLLTPHSDPSVYEHPFDYLFDTPELARKALAEFGVQDAARDEGWVLCKRVLTPVVDTFYIITFVHKHGMDTWPHWSQIPPTEDEIWEMLAKECSLEEGERERYDTYVEVTGPFTCAEPERA